MLYSRAPGQFLLPIGGAPFSSIRGAIFRCMVDLGFKQTETEIIGKSEESREVEFPVV
jgi:hypothetical protein